MLHELLAEGGSLYVHLDWHVSHYANVQHVANTSGERCPSAQGGPFPLRVMPDGP
jgi:hypothetical protein